MERKNFGIPPQSRWVLGAASFGSRYGLANNGPTMIEEVGRILDLAREHNLRAIDTAPSYGESESFLGSHQLDGFDIYTKVSSTSLHSTIVEETVNSLARLRTEALYGLTLHDTTVFKEWESVSIKSIGQLKEMGLVQFWGVSVYDLEELEAILRVCTPDYIQAPVNIFDQRFVSPRVTDLLQGRGVRLQARSILLQGLLASTPDAHDPYFRPWAPEIEALTQLARQSGMSLAHLAFEFVSKLNQVDSVVLGIANLNQLLDLIRFWESPIENRQVAFPEFQLERDLVDPRMWPKFH